MFAKAVIILLLLIVFASLLAPRSPASPARSRPPSRLRPLMFRIALVLLFMAAAVAALHLAGCTPAPPPFHGQDIRGADFGDRAVLSRLTDTSGRRPTSADFAGRLTVVTFGYTHCPDVCPTTLAAWQEVLARLGPRAEAVRVYFVTLDPERDDAERLAAYLAWFDPRILGLRGDTETTRAVAQAYRIIVSRTEGSGTIDHTAASFVYDLQGHVRLKIPFDLPPEKIAADLARLLDEPS